MTYKYFFKFLDKSKKRGMIKYNNGYIYEGYIHDKLPHGSGKMIYNLPGHPCEIYIGNWKNGKKDGEGTYNTKIGSYTGQWKNDKYDGTGVLISKYGDYRGEFVNGKRHGKGKIIQQNGDVYEGEFKNNRYNGFGKITYSNGDACEGEFKNNEIVHAKCKYIYKNNDTYFGDVKDGFAHGKGRWVDATNNLIYDGHWKDGNLTGKVTILTKTLGRKSETVLHRNIDFNKVLKKFHDPEKYYHYLIPDISKYYGRSETGLKQFIRSSVERAEFIARESSNKNTHDQIELYKNKPSSYFFISAHGSYDMSSFSTTSGVNTFTIPEGIRLVFFDKSEINLASSIDKIVTSDAFMKPSLIQRKTYRKITPIVLFSELQEGSITIDVCDALDKTILNKTYQQFRKFIAEQKADESHITVLDILKDIDLQEYIDTFHSNGITHSDDLASLKDSDLIDFGINEPVRSQMLHKFNELKNSKYKLSIYDSNMECTNLSLYWNPEIGDGNIMKLGVYPLPNSELQHNSNSHLKDGNGEIIHHKIFSGGFMPDEDYKGNFRNYTDPMIQWNLFSDSITELSELINYLPKGTLHHPCVYFVSACRSISDEFKPRFKGLVRQHSNTVHRQFFERQLSDSS